MVQTGAGAPGARHYFGVCWLIAVTVLPGISGTAKAQQVPQGSAMGAFVVRCPPGIIFKE